MMRFIRLDLQQQRLFTVRYLQSINIGVDRPSRSITITLDKL